MKVTILIDNHTQSNLTAEWGLAAHIEYRGHKILLDAGTTGAFAQNAELLQINLAEVEYAVLSHAHYDHADGMAEFFAKNKTCSFYLREGSGENCFDLLKEPYKYIGIHQGYLEKYKDRIVYVSGDYELLAGVTLIPHKTAGLEAVGQKMGMYLKKGNTYLPDNFSHEQSLVFDTEQGLVIFNSCCHGGADCVIREITQTYPEKPIYALIGGFHLYKATDDEVKALAQRIRQTGIQKIYTGHCTGDTAMHILQKELGDMVTAIYTGSTCTFFE